MKLIDAIRYEIRIDAIVCVCLLIAGTGYLLATEISLESEIVEAVVIQVTDVPHSPPLMLVRLPNGESAEALSRKSAARGDTVRVKIEHRMVGPRYSVLSH